MNGIHTKLSWIVIAAGLLHGTVAAGEVTCENDAGKCTLDDTGGECSCMNGIGTGWSEGYDPSTEPDTTPPTEDDCLQALIENCGEEAPDINDYCDEASLALCTEATGHYYDLDENCSLDSGDDSVSTGDPDDDEVGYADSGVAPTTDGDPDQVFPPPPEWEPDFADLASCCEGLESSPEYEDFLACLLALEKDDCDGANQCIDQHEKSVDDNPTGTDLADNEQDKDDAVDAGVDGTTADEGDDSTCQVTTVASGNARSLIRAILSLFQQR